MKIIFQKKSFSFKLSSVVINSQCKIILKKGWIIKIKNKYDDLGFGEISPIFEKDYFVCEKEINQIEEENNLKNILINIRNFHPCIQSGIISGIAEMQGQIKFRKYYPFDKIDQTAILLNSSNILNELNLMKKNLKYKNKNITIKWKVGIETISKEEYLLETILSEIPNNFKLRIDANGAWSRKLANRWADILKDNKNLDWFEQPLAAEDFDGLKKLNKKIPIALDESLLKFPDLIKSWEGWQIRRPSQERNPLNLLQELIEKKSYIAISSSFETGIARRLLFHFSFIQLEGPTPKVPGLALKQTPQSILFSNNPNIIWERL